MKIDYITIFTSKLNESIQFYTEVLNFENYRTIDTGDATLVFLADGFGSNIELVDNGQRLERGSSCPVAITSVVPSVKAIEEMLHEKQVPITFGPITMPSGVTLLHIEDPQGVTINFVEMDEE